LKHMIVWGETVLPRDFLVAVEILRRKITDYHRFHLEVENILSLVMIYDEVVAEMYHWRLGTMDRFEGDLAAFSFWFDSRVAGQPITTGAEEKFRLDEKNLYLIFSFRDTEKVGQLHLIKPDKLVESGRNIDKLIVSIGQNRGTFCPCCGIRKGELHTLGCQLEQCASCDGLLASCLCGSAKNLPFGWKIAKFGAIPRDNVRISYEEENYSAELKGFVESDLGFNLVEKTS
jgi:hypothetical protein